MPRNREILHGLTPRGAIFHIPLSQSKAAVTAFQSSILIGTCVATRNADLSQFGGRAAKEQGMTELIKKMEWKDFFCRISRDFLDWETSIEVMSENAGARILSEGLPFNGMTFDEKHGLDQMEVAIGIGTDHHHTHNISDPRKVAFEPSGRGSGGTLDIEDASGTTTLINFIQPMPVTVEYVKSEILTIV
jgi:hypothetical protein